MDPQSGLLSRAGTSLWTLFQGAVNYITSAVGRYLRPEPPNTGNDDINIIPEATVCKQRERSHEEEEKSLNANYKEKEEDDAENSGKNFADPCQITLSTDTESKTTQWSVEYVKSMVTEKGDKAHERSREDHDQLKIIPVTANLNNEDAEEKGLTQEEIQQGDTHMRHGCLIEPRKGEKGKQDNHQTEDDIQWQKEQKVAIKQDHAKSTEDDFKGERRFFGIKVKTVGSDYRTMEGCEGILGIKERQPEMRKGEDDTGINQSYKESEAEQEGNEQSGRLEETETTSREGQISCQENEKNKVNIQALKSKFTEQEREKHRLEDKGEMEEIRGELETLNQNQESVSVEGTDESCAIEKSGEDGKRETYSSVLERRKEIEYRPHRAQTHSDDEDDELDTNQEEERKTGGEQIGTREVEREGGLQEVNIETKFKMTVVKIKDGKDEENEKETKSDEEETTDLENREIQMGKNFEEPQDEIKQDDERGWKEEVQTTRVSGHGSVTENEKHKKEMKGIKTEIIVSVKELEREMQRIEEEEDVEEITEDLEAADEPQEFVTTEEKEELCTLEKGSRVGEMEVCSSEFERGEERDNYVAKEDVKIHFEDQWPVQEWTEEHLTLGFDFQELEKTHKEVEMIPEDKVVAISQTQWRDDNKDEVSAQQARETETEHRCHRPHDHSGVEDEESDTNEEEEKKADAEQTDAGKMETEGEPQEVYMEIKHNMTEAETKYGKDEETEEETRSDDVETPDLGKREIALETNFKESEDEIKEVESGRVEDNKSIKEKGQGSVTENEKHTEFKHLEREITVSLELGKERERIEEEDDVEEMKDLEAECKYQESVTEEGEESCAVEKGSKDGKRDVYSSDVEKRKGKDPNIQKGDTEVHFDDQCSVQIGTKEHFGLGFDFQESETTNKETVQTITKEDDVEGSGTQWRDYMTHEDSVYKQTENNQKEKRKTDEEQIDTEEMKMEEPQEINIEMKYKIVTVESEDRNDENDVETPELGEDEIELNKKCKEPQHEIKGEEEFRSSVNTESSFGDELGNVLENERNDGLHRLEGEITVNTLILEKLKQSKEEKEEMNDLIEHLETEDKSQKPIMMEAGEESHAVKKGWEDGEREVCSTELKEEENSIKAKKQDIKVQFEDRWTAQSEGHLPSLVSSQKIATAHKTGQATAVDKPVDISVTQWRDDMQPEESIYKGTETDENGKSQRTKGQTGEKDGSHNVSIEWDIEIKEEDAVHEETNEAVSQQSIKAEELSFSRAAENEEDKELCRREDIFNRIEMKHDSKVKGVNAVEMRDEIIEVNQEAITRSVDELEEREVGETGIDDIAGIRDEFHVKDTTGKNVEETECRKDESRTEHVWEMQTEKREEQVVPAYVASMGQKEKGGENTVDESVTERGAEVFVEGEGIEVVKWQSMSSKNKVVGKDTEGSDVLVDEKEELQVRKDAEEEIIERNATNELAETQTEHKGYVRQESKDRITMEDNGKNLIMVLDVNTALAEDYKDKSAHDELGAVTLRSGLAENKSEEERKSDYNGGMRAQVCKTDEKQEVTKAKDWVEHEETAKEKTDNSEVYRQEVERTKIQGEDTKQEQNKSDETESYGRNGKTEMLVTETLDDEEKEEQPMSMGGTKKEVDEEIRADVRNEDIAQDDVRKREDEQIYEDESKKFVLQVDAPSLDFTAQKSRIALKNHLVRPPKDPRILLQKASVIPIHSAPPQEEGFNTKPVMMKVGGGGVMGIKLPGFGGGIPALKKKEKGVSEKNQ
ncbi:trichohyalin isoform X2 [Scleropages formosus]|uniref:trichohyalin isoform X2 n=1 Tax=Scleropages formosus TaxID=113540 RepID=UPI000877F2BF|nr:trichohyalin-like isoform X2 [Scleropages formosus]